MIRLAIMEDHDRIVELGRRYLLMGPYREQITDNPVQVDRFFQFMLTNPSARVLVCEEEGAVAGVFAFIIYPHYYGGDLVANEIIWCVDEHHRGRASLELLHTAEHLAFSLGAQRMALSAPTPEVASLYNHLKGYTLVEIGYQAKLCDRGCHASH